METGMNIPQNSTVIYNLITYLLDEVITVTRRKSRQFNFSFNINHIEFKDKFLTKPTRM